MPDATFTAPDLTTFARLDDLASHIEAPHQCDQPRSELLAAEDPTNQLDPVPGNVFFSDLSRYFCNEKSCTGLIGNVVVYRDAHHLTDEYVATLAPTLDREIQAALATLE